MSYKHFFFDMDKTVTPARQFIKPHMAERLRALGSVIIVSGSTLENITHQTQGLPAYYLGTNGNHANDVENNDLWQNPHLTEEQKAEIRAHIDALCALIDHDINHEWVPVEDRGMQITFSPLGNVAPPELKHVYDPDRQKRRQWLEQVPFLSDEIAVRIGGSTSLDYFHKDRHKGANVKRFIEHFGLDPATCVYFGDGLVPGGNDESVIGVIDTVLVQDEEDTFLKLEKFL